MDFSAIICQPSLILIPILCDSTVLSSSYYRKEAGSWTWQCFIMSQDRQIINRKKYDVELYLRNSINYNYPNY